MIIVLLLTSWALFFMAGYYVRDLHVRGHLMPINRVARWLEQSPALVKAMIGATCLMLSVTILSSVSWLRAVEARDRATVALDSANSVAACQIQATRDALDLWRSFKRQFSEPTGTDKERQAAFFKSIDEYIASLERLLKARENADPEGFCQKATK